MLHYTSLLMLGAIWWSCVRNMWIFCPVEQSQGTWGMSTIVDLHAFHVIFRYIAFAANTGLNNNLTCHINHCMAAMLWTLVVYISYGTVSWCLLHLCHTCTIIIKSLGSTGLIWYLCHRYMWIIFSFHGVCDISTFFNLCTIAIIIRLTYLLCQLPF